MAKRNEPGSSNIIPSNSPPSEEADSNKPTFGEASVFPGTEQAEAEVPNVDPGLEASNDPNHIVQTNTTDEPNKDKTPFDPNRDTADREADIEAAAEKLREKFTGTEPGHKTDPENVDETTEAKTKDHDISEEGAEALRIQELEQKISQRNDPDRTQREGDHPSTESLTSAPASRPTTIDPMTGQVHYVGDEAALPGGTVAHEAE